jgi:hypothetical protein
VGPGHRDGSNRFEREWGESKEIGRIAPRAARHAVATSPAERLFFGTAARDATRNVLSVGSNEKEKFLRFIGLVQAKTLPSFHS